MTQPSLRLITTFGLGHMRPASGTWGSLPPVIIAGLMLWLGPRPSMVQTMPPGDTKVWSEPMWAMYHVVLLIILLVFSIACIRDGEVAEARFGKKDPGQVVADETAGQCLPLLFLPASAVADAPALLATLALAFFSFRFIDIVKPWPARQLQRIPGGWGILIDDLVAGVYAAIVVQVVTQMGWIGA